MSNLHEPMNPLSGMQVLRSTESRYFADMKSLKTNITDPAAKQCAIREDRPLPGRE